MQPNFYFPPTPAAAPFAFNPGILLQVLWESGHRAKKKENCGGRVGPPAKHKMTHRDGPDDMAAAPTTSAEPDAPPKVIGGDGKGALEGTTDGAGGIAL